MTKIPTQKLLKLTKGSKIKINGNIYTITRISHYKTVKEYDDNKDYGGGVKLVLGSEHYLFYEHRDKLWRFIRVTQKRGLIFLSENHLQVTIKEIKILNKG